VSVASQMQHNDKRLTAVGKSNYAGEQKQQHSKNKNKHKIFGNNKRMMTQI
jgi:hypothetical protein